MIVAANGNDERYLDGDASDMDACGCAFFVALGVLSEAHGDTR